MRPSRPASILLAVTLLGSTAACSQPIEQESTLIDYRLVTVASGLSHPWSIAFLPGGDMLVTEREGRLRIIRDGVLLETPVPGVPEVFAQGQGGLLDVALHPDFESNRLVYLSFSKPLADGSTTAVVRGRLDRDRLADVEEIFEAQTRGRGHYGSRLAFDRDGYLFVTVGDRQASPEGDLSAHPAQDLSNHHGTINRLHDDGRIPEDNPFVGVEGALPEIWSYGHRNPQGLAVHPETGVVWSDEHGPQGGDELNLVLPGRNYGWPVIGFGVNYGGATIHDSTAHEGMVQPVHWWVPSIATSGLLVYTGEPFREWKGNLFVGGLAGVQLARLTMDGNTVVAEETLVQGVGRIRDVRQGPDGLIYLAIDADGGPMSIVRLEPVRAE
jgi:glucose/arabinose dehydrogenase